MAADRAHDQTKTVLPAEVARGVFMQHAPSLAALKLMHVMIAKAGGRMADDVRHELRLADIRAIDGLKNHDRASLTPLFAELAATVLTHDDPEKMVVTIGGLLDEARIDYRDEVSSDLLVSWYFRRTFRRMAEESNHWAILDRQTVFHLGSRYSVLLFQHISSLIPLEHVSGRTFTVPELRAVLGIPDGKIKRFANLKMDVLDPAIAEINHLSRLTLSVTTKKIGRTVASVTISWTEKAPDKKAEAKSELNRPKAGREARRAGTVEQVEPIAAGGDFPASGSIEYSQWAEIARDCLPFPRPDLDHVAARYRQWTDGKGIARTEMTWRSFCRRWKG